MVQWSGIAVAGSLAPHAQQQQQQHTTGNGIVNFNGSAVLPMQRKVLSFAPVQKPWLKQQQPYRQFGQQLQWNNNSFGKAKGKGFQPQPWQPPWLLQQNQQRPVARPPDSLPPNFQVDPDQRYAGIVKFYNKPRGFGFVQLSLAGVVPKDEVFVHWRNIQSDDRFPSLRKDMEVEISLLKWRDNRGRETLRAKQVTYIGGANVALQDEEDAQTKTFVGGQHLRYTGTLKFFLPRQGYGYITLDEGYDLPNDVPKDIRLEHSEVNAGGQQPVFMQNLAVEFGIWRNLKGGYKAYNTTLPGGHPLTQDALENRIAMGSQSYTGEIVMLHQFGWGFIKVDPHVQLSQRVMQKLQQMQADTIARGKRVSEDRMLYFRKTDCLLGFFPARGARVTYQVYVDDKGAGACEITFA